MGDHPIVTLQFPLKNVFRKLSKKKVDKDAKMQKSKKKPPPHRFYWREHPKFLESNI